MTLEEVLGSFDERRDPFNEHSVERAVNQLRSQLKDKGEEPDEKFMAESMAFGFMEDCKNSGWGTYFGPMMVMPNEKGQMMESPSVQLVTEDMLKSWSQRAKKAKHPILRARYAGLVWDFSKRVTGNTGKPDMPRIVIDATIEIATKNLHQYENDVITKLERSLSLALSLNDTERAEKVRDTIILYEDSIAKDDKRGLWGFAFDLLMENKCISLSDDQEKKIIADLEARLGRVSDTSGKYKLNPFAAESAALRLGRYYRKLGRGDDVKRVLLRYGNAFLKLAELSEALVGSSWLQKVHSVYLQFGMKAEADEITIPLRKTGKKCKDEMKAISGEIKVSKEKMDKYIEFMVGGGLEVALNRIASNYIPKREEVVEQIKKISKEHPISFLMPAVIQDNKGQPVAQIGSLEEDIDGHVVRHTGQNMVFSAFFLRKVIEGLKAKYKLSAKKILDHIYISPIFEVGKRSIIEAGLKAYFKKDYLVAVHLLIPQIEDAVRNLVEFTGGVIYKKGRSGGLFLKTFDEILHDEIVIQSLGENAVLYLRILFTDQRGWNLRNSVCHGISPADSFNSTIADRVFHTLLLLGQLRQTDSKKGNQEQD